MGWLYVPGLRVSSSGSSSPSEIPIAPSVTWKGKPLRPSYWPAVWKKAISKWRLSGTISNPSMATRGVESWIFSARASLASQSLALGSDEPKKTSDGFGLTSLASFARYDRESSYWRTYQGSLFADSETFSESWPPSGSMRSGACFQRRASGHRTSGAGFSFWPGVSATRYGSSQNEGKVPHDRPSRGAPSLDTLARNWPTPRAEDAESCGNHPGRQDSLNATARLWPTPNVPNGGRSMRAEDIAKKGATGKGKRQVGLENVARLWATPMTSDTKRGSGTYMRGNLTLTGQARQWPTPTVAGNRNSSDYGDHGNGLETEAKRWPTAKVSGRHHLPIEATNGPRVLNPRFVEWLMGFPIGWTELLPLEMESFQSWRRKHSSLLRSVL